MLLVIILILVLDIYRAHIFTSSGTFNVTSLGGFGPKLNILSLLVAGGGAGEGGGGGGGLRTNLSGILRWWGTPVIGPYTYTVTIGGRGFVKSGPMMEDLTQVFNGTDSTCIFGQSANVLLVVEVRWWHLVI